MSTDTLKTSICDALAAFIRQRPGFDYSNYGDAASYRADSRRASLQKRDAETLLQAVRWRDSISGADILEAARGGRLTIVPHDTCGACDGSGIGAIIANRDGTTRNVPCDGEINVRIDYCTGQYFPTGFRAGVCRVLSSALWNWQRESMPAPYAHRVEWQDGKSAVMQLHAMTDARNADPTVRVYDLYREPGSPLGSMSAGDWLRAKFRREFGSSLARRWFN